MTPLCFKKQWCAALGLLLSLGIPAPPAGAHSGDRVYPIPELTDGMLEKVDFNDGSVDEWYDLIGEPTMTLLDFSGGGT